MTLEELTDHTANVRQLLNDKRRNLPYMDPITAGAVLYQIRALEPRVRELEDQCLALADKALTAL
jgi:hypothetical protein